MRRLGWVVFWLLAVIYLAVIFLPKKELYFQAERELQTQKIFVSGERVQDLGLGLRLEGGQLRFNDMEIANLSQTTLWVTLFVNRLEVGPFELGRDLGALLPSRVDRIVATHAIWAPHLILLEASGAFGEARGRVNLLDRNLSITLDAPGEIQNQYRPLFQQMRSSEEGFVYELAF